MSIKNCKLELLLFALLIWVQPILGQTEIADKESAYYNITTVPIPEDVVLEVGGLAFDEKGNLGATTRRGELWVINNPESNRASFKRYAQGLHEPLGLAYKDGSYYLSQRGELTKITDTNGDGRGDVFDNIYNWDLEGNYHEYAYGPEFLPNGNMLITLNLAWIGRGASLSKWSGWMLEISPEGEMTPIATGMRSPAGFGFNKNGDVFYTENQGDWVGSGRMTHVEKGDFVGNPEGLKWTGEPGSPLTLKFEDITDDEPTTLYDYSKKESAVKPPSVWFPHTLMGISTSDVEIVPEGWGPFAGQLLVGDQGHSKIMRVYQEKVNDVYQGICFPFKEGFSSGLLRMEWSPDNSTMYVGMTNRGWASTGKKKYGLQRLKWTGVTPFEMHAVNIQPDGFVISFTEEVDRRTAANPDSYSITDFNFMYHHVYGSPPINQEERTVYKVEVAQDNMSARLYVEGLRHGYVNEIKASGLRSVSGKELLHHTGYYTINEIPGKDAMVNSVAGTSHDMDHSNHADLGDKYIEKPSAKRVTDMPDSWTQGEDVTLELEAIAGMLFDKRVLRAKPGAKVKLVFNNPDDMIHNLLLVKPGTADDVATMAMNLGLKGEEMGFIPESENIIAHTTLLRPNSNDVIYFEAPMEPGRYQYVCTFPAHAATMRGVLIVK